MTLRQHKREQATKQAQLIAKWKRNPAVGLPSWAYKRTTVKKKR